MPTPRRAINESGASRETTPELADRWARICAIFDEVGSAQPDQWNDLIATAAGADPDLAEEVAQLLAASRADHFHFEEPTLALGVDPETERDEHRLGESIGPYRLRRLLGAGGMGAVYEGVRVDGTYEQRVAIKLIRVSLGMAGVASRFRRERQILATLEHRNIARLMDGGATDRDEPFLVMEYVDGTPITKFCNAHGLSLRARLQLFLQACVAVEHAHGKLIVHRDIKPANILVTADGSVKLLDFGVAKLLGGADDSIGHAAGGGDTPTQVGHRALTPEYASPEHLRDEPATVASDVFSLGVVLYELLAGRRPYVLSSRSTAAALRALKESAPKPSTVATSDAATHVGEVSVTRLSRALAGDLDSIVLKAIDAEPARRYSSVERLANDIRRYLDGRPVIARPETLTYSAGKFVRRNIAAVTSGAVAVLLLLGGSLATTLQARRADAQATRAEAERAKAARINGFLRDMLAAPDPRWTVGGIRHASQQTVSDVLDAAAQRASVDFVNAPDVESSVRQTLGRTYTALGRYDLASTQLTRALALDRALRSPSVPLIVTDLHDLGMARLRSGDNVAADTLFRLTLRLCATDDQRADSAHVCGQTINDLGLATMSEDKLVEAQALFQKALTLARSILGPNHPAVAIVLGNLGMVCDSRGDLTDAEKYYRSALAAFAKAPRELSERAYTLANLGRMLGMMGRLPEGQALLQQAIAIATRTEGPQHPDLGMCWVRLGAIHRQMGLLSAAVAETSRGFTILDSARAPGSEYAISVNTDRTLLMLATGQLHAATVVASALLDSAKTQYSADDSRLAEVQDAVGQVMLASGERRKAIALLQASYATFRANFGPTHPQTLLAEQHLEAAMK